MQPIDNLKEIDNPIRIKLVLYLKKSDILNFKPNKTKEIMENLKINPVALKISHQNKILTKITIQEKIESRKRKS